MELTNATPDQLVHGTESAADTAHGVGRPLTVPNPPSMANHRAIVVASIEKAQRKLDRMRKDEQVPAFVVSVEEVSRQWASPAQSTAAPAQLQLAAAARVYYSCCFTLLSAAAGESDRSRGKANGALRAQAAEAASAAVGVGVRGQFHKVHWVWSNRMS